jgi:hypothetical protein
LKSDQFSHQTTEINYDIIDGSVRASTIIELAQEQVCTRQLSQKNRKMTN